MTVPTLRSAAWTLATLLSVACSPNAAHARPRVAAPPSSGGGATVVVQGSLEPQRTVAVNGSCLREIAPDRGSVQITVETRHAEPRRAAQLATEQYERVRKAVVELKLKDEELRTTEYRVDQEWVWEKDRRVNKGFVARMGMRVETSETARLGEVIARAGDLNVQDVGGLTLFVTQARQRSEHDACLVEATEHARTKAERLAKAAGARLGEALTLREDAGANPYPPPMPVYRSMAAKSAEMDAGMAAPTVDAGKQTIQVTVGATFALSN